MRRTDNGVPTYNERETLPDVIRGLMELPGVRVRRYLRMLKRQRVDAAGRGSG